MCSTWARLGTAVQTRLRGVSFAWTPGDCLAGMSACTRSTAWRPRGRITFPNAAERVAPHEQKGHYSSVLGPDGAWSLPGSGEE